jgi:hypothetical protein
MSTGDSSDVLSRIKALLPAGWFRDPTPVLDAILTGPASALAQVYGLTAYARLQTRITTASDGFLDLISFDFFGTTLPRRPQEADAAFRNRILAQLLLEKGTRRGLTLALELLTGHAPWIFEPARPADTGAYNTGNLAYDAAGGYGSLQLPYQAFVVAYRPPGQGIPSVAGYGDPQGAYGAGQAEYVTPAMLQGVVTDDAIYAAIASVKPEATVVWTRIENFAPNAGLYTDEAGIAPYADESSNPYTTEY